MGLFWRLLRVLRLFKLVISVFYKLIKRSSNHWNYKVRIDIIRFLNAYFI